MKNYIFLSLIISLKCSAIFDVSYEIAPLKSLNHYTVSYRATVSHNNKNSVITKYKQLRKVLLQTAECLAFKISISTESNHVNIYIQQEWSSYNKYSNHINNPYCRHLLQEISYLTDDTSYIMGHPIAILSQEKNYKQSIIVSILQTIGLGTLLWQLYTLDWGSIARSSSLINLTNHKWFKYLKTPALSSKDLTNRKIITSL